MMDFSISKSVRLQWIRWIPSERLSTPSFFGLAWSVPLSTTIPVITMIKMLWTHEVHSTDHAKPHFDWFFNTISTSKKMYKRHCVTQWREQRCLDSYRQRQISRSDSEISSTCDKNLNLNIMLSLTLRGQLWNIKMMMNTNITNKLIKIAFKNNVTKFTFKIR